MFPVGKWLVKGNETGGFLLCHREGLALGARTTVHPSRSTYATLGFGPSASEVDPSYKACCRLLLSSIDSALGQSPPYAMIITACGDLFVHVAEAPALTHKMGI